MQNKNFKKFIKKVDIFGKKIELNYDKNGSTHKTYLGGFLTILYVTFIMAYLAYGFLNI
jgi:hypothetical protein